MTIPLSRLRTWPLTTPDTGQITIAVARHEAESSTDTIIGEYAKHRAQLLHQLVDGSGVLVTSWGETDIKYPREVVEIILVVSPPLIAAIAVVLAAWISRPRTQNTKTEEDRPKPPPSTDVLLPGIAIKRPDGAELRLTYRDGLSNRAVTKLITEFLNQTKPSAGAHK